jgi:hypothetical protein
MFVSPVPPVAPPIGQLWHQTGVKLERVPKLETVLRWDGEGWVIAGYVIDNPSIMKQGKQACDFQEALAYVHENARWFDCEFIYTYDGSTWYHHDKSMCRGTWWTLSTRLGGSPL